MATYYRKLCQQLKAAGFVQVVGGKGSHEKWHNAEKDITLIVPHNLKKKHTANGILKSAGLKPIF